MDAYLDHINFNENQRAKTISKRPHIYNSKLFVCGFVFAEIQYTTLFPRMSEGVYADKNVSFTESPTYHVSNTFK